MTVTSKDPSLSLYEQFFGEAPTYQEDTDANGTSRLEQALARGDTLAIEKLLRSPSPALRD